uniref:Thymidylate kinase n=1 Tax=Plectus sambesii TaxID=2011161 RepID=A0A914XHV0_9BILA
MVATGSSPGRGALIVFEGCDRSGKTTQTQKLFDCLVAMGRKVELWRFPERTTGVGKMIDEYLKSGNNLPDEAIHLLFSANRWETAPLLKSKLAAGVTIITDRYAFSGVAFSAAKGLDLNWCKSPDVGLPLPDCVVFCDLHPEKAAKRGGFGEERYENIDMQLKVYHQFQKLRQSDWKVVDASQSVDDMHEEIKTLALEAMDHCTSKPQQRSLWSATTTTNEMS